MCNKPNISFLKLMSIRNKQISWKKANETKWNDLHDIFIEEIKQYWSIKYIRINTLMMIIISRIKYIST